MYIHFNDLQNNHFRVQENSFDDGDIYFDELLTEGSYGNDTLELIRKDDKTILLRKFDDDLPYTVQRRREYPPIGDQLDALWKLIQTNADKIDLAEAAPLLAAVQEIKNKYPKE